VHQSAACRVDPEDSPPIFINIWLSRILALLAVAMARSPAVSYFNMGVSDVQMGDLLKVHYGTNTYGLRYLTVSFF
jgi:hypothetical protein